MKKDRNSFHQVDTADMAADDGVSVGDCCLPAPHAEDDESEDQGPWTLREYLLALALGVFTLGVDLLVLYLLGTR